LLTHNKCRGDPSRTTFSKCVIKNVINPLQWEVGPPWAPRKFSQTFQPQFYNYYDYHATWYNAFYFQNDRFQHSWFFFFDKHLEVQSLPTWFQHWWLQFGPEPSILPSKLLDEKTKETEERVHFPFSLTQIYENFLTNFQTPPALCKFPKLLAFFTRYSLQWIMGWDFDISPLVGKIYC
jgi:hypothetical protein